MMQLVLKGMINKLVRPALLTVFIFLSGCGSEGSKIKETLPNEKPATGVAGDAQLNKIIDYIRIAQGLPALAAILIKNDKVIELAATGLRSIDDKINTSIDDKWHIGSITKSMTSTLAAKLEHQGVIQWNTRIADVYPELLGVMREEYEEITLEQLLSHTSGMRANIPTLVSFYFNNDDITKQRTKVVEQALLLAPTVSAGSFLYSNLGYIVAGAMMERLTGTSWETLLENEIFTPLMMNSSGFGAPDANYNLEQPLGHKSQGNGWKAIHVSAIEKADNPSVMGPAGTVHASLNDMAKYLGAHLAGAQGKEVLGFLPSSSFKKMHTPVTQSNYALGWANENNGLTHNGSNTLWLATVVINPDDDFALFVVTNAADLDKNNSAAAKANELAIAELTARIKKYNQQ